MSIGHVRDSHLASPHLPGNRPISTERRVDGLDLVLDVIGTSRTSHQVDMVVDYIAVRYERGEIDGARQTAMSMLGIDLIGAYRLEAVLHRGS